MVQKSQSFHNDYPKGLPEKVYQKKHTSVPKSIKVEMPVMCEPTPKRRSGMNNRLNYTSN